MKIKTLILLIALAVVVALVGRHYFLPFDNPRLDWMACELGKIYSK